MTQIEKTKVHIKKEVYREVIGNLENYFNDLSVNYMPINGLYFYYCNNGFDFEPTQLFQTIEIVLRKDDYAKVVTYFNSSSNLFKVVDIEFKSAFSYSIDGINVVRVDLYNSFNFPNTPRCSEELFSIGIHSNQSSIILPCPEYALLFLIGKSFHFMDRFFDYSILKVIPLVISSKNFSWTMFWHIAKRNNIERFSKYVLNLCKEHSLQGIPEINIDLYSRILSSKVMSSIYKVYPRILRKVFFKTLLTDNPLKYFLKQLSCILNRSMKKTGDQLYQKVIGTIARRYIVENENTVFNTIMATVNRKLSGYHLDYSLQEDFIVGTSSGLWYLRGDQLSQLTFASSYGITFDGKKWYANQNLGQFSRIISFEIDSESVRPVINNPNYFALGLPKSVHQIDYYKDVLYTVDTLNNRIITIDCHGKKKFYSQNKNSKKSQIDNHFNSIYITEKYVYLCAHNGTLVPKRYSEIYVLHRSSMKLHEVIQTKAGNAHNFIFKDEKILYCDSVGGHLVHGNKSVFNSSDYFIRGLAVTGNYVLAGGSGFARREERAATDGALFILDKSFNHLKTFQLENIGQVYEIRGVSGDYGLSSNKTDSWEPVITR